MQRTGVDRDRLHAPDRNGGGNFGEEPVLGAQVFADARQPKIIETHQRPDHRDDANHDEKHRETNRADRDAVHRKRTAVNERPEQIAKKEAVEQLTGHAVEQP